MLYNLNTVSGAKTHLRLILVQNPEAAPPPQVCLTLKTGTETLHLTPDTFATDEFIIPPLVTGRYSYELLIAEHPTLHGALVVRPSALSGHPAECTADIRIDLPCILVSLTQGPRGLKGERGFSAYEIATQNGYLGSESEWVAELKGSQTAATQAKEQATAAASSATTASEKATAAETSAAKAASAAEGAAASATAAANSATAAATAADAVKYDLLPMSVDWLHTQFVREIGDGNFAVTFNEEQQTLAVAFAHDIPEEQCERLLELCGRFTPQNVGVVREAVPTDFTELVYLESSGTQYIDTGVITDGSYTISVTFKSIPNSTSIEWICGRQNTWTAQEFVGDSLIYFYNKDGSFYVYQGARCKAAAVQGDTFDVVWSEGTMTIIVNGEEKKLTNITPAVSIDASNPTNKSHYLFKPNGDITSTAGIICGFSAWDGAGVKVINLIPVLDETGEPYMWDTVSRRKLPNAGTGRFGYRIKGTDVVVKPNATTYSLRAPRDPYYVAPSGVFARKVGENELEIIADTEETSGEGWVCFANTAEAYEHFGIVQDNEELLTE